MDDEDRAEAEEARQVSTKASYAGLGSTEDEVSRRAPLMDLFRASGDTIGIKLLSKMGWREGQGIGPRVWRTAVLNEGGPAKQEDKKHLFAPKNTKMVSFKRKDDRKGLGFQGEDRLEHPAIRDEKHSDEEGPDVVIKAKKKIPKKSAFGVGVLNDTGSDDEDPYSLGPKISYNKIIGGDKKKKKKAETRAGANSNPLLKDRPVFISRKINHASSGFRKCHDGRLPLQGFILSTISSTVETNKYPPPSIPTDWTPSRSPLTDTSGDIYMSTTDLAKASTLEPHSRGNLLGEAPLPGKSVFDFLKPDARARIVSLTKNESLPPAGSEAAPTASTDIVSQIPSLDPSIASAALGRGVGGFVPYSDNPAKLERYRAYLTYCADISTEIPTRPKDLPQEEWLRELHEFAHAATIFKPMTGAMASRFTTSSSTNTKPSSTTDNDLQIIPQKKIKDPAEEAASMNMFGPMTRSSEFFYPSRLLCKRFNVPVPSHVNSNNEGKTAPSAQENSKAEEPLLNFSSRFQSSGFQTAPNAEPVRSKDLGSVREQQSSLLLPTQETQANLEPETTRVNPERNEALEAARPGEEVFKAIFGSDSEDD
jgi:G patch domain-containing protein 1